MTNVNADPDPLQVESGDDKIEPPPSPPGPAFHGGSKNVVSQKLSEVNLTLGGIDLNSSGSVVVKEDKKLITVLFTDGRDGRAFTLKAETLEDLHEWKTALEKAISNAPNAALVMGQNGIFRNDQTNGTDQSSEHSKDKQTSKSLVIGRPILLALEDIDGTPSFLEKALQFLEEHGVKTEGILRQAADVEDVERRIQEYEKGKTELSPNEDAHVIADCIKYVLRELPSSPVPASCCKALLEACRSERSMRINVVRSAILETFPEPNRCLLQRILRMMQKVASNKGVNRMSVSAVAACMAPLLLRPLLAGDCDLDQDFDVGGDNSLQLLQAAAAANHAQAIVITLLEEYDNIFGDHAVTHEPYTDSEESGSESEEITDDDEEEEEDNDDDDDSFDEDDSTEDSNSYVDQDSDHQSTPSTTKTGDDRCSKKSPGSSGSKSPRVDDNAIDASKIWLPNPYHAPLDKHDIPKVAEKNVSDSKMQSSPLEQEDKHSEEASVMQRPPNLSCGVRSVRRPAVWGRTPAKKNLSMESIELPSDDETEIQKLECIKVDLQTRISIEAMENSRLLNSLQKQKHDLHEHRVALEKEVASLQEQLENEVELKAILEVALNKSEIPFSISPLVDEKMRAELDEISRAEADVANLRKNVDDLEFRLDQQREQTSKMKDKKTDGELVAVSRTCESFSNSNKVGDGTQNPNAAGYMTSNVEMSTSRTGHAHSVSRKSSTKTEGNNSTTSALSKLTNRLNFLKERRTQIASELQNLDKARQPVLNLEQRNCQFVDEPKGQQSSDNYGFSHTS
ncbi:Rho GTPase activation protein (RhoGAP) with PH domain [Striga hermonthica]|uniref:Rho GTPase activation protein (RhoGAP) with PH domain n=1 Tax=Striga hermonthica TaxID=68872 RepID=A0A9N7RPF8_STRHE|nr:Rho GTPase activation protein (RhoGAP) with PH domain [Striga hermonthica]